MSPCNAHSLGRPRDRPLWPAIRNRTAAIGFDRYKTFIDSVFSERDDGGNVFSNADQRVVEAVRRHLRGAEPEGRLSIYGPYAYNVLKHATQIFLTLESGVVIRDLNSPGTPPVIFEHERRAYSSQRV